MQILSNIKHISLALLFVTLTTTMSPIVLALTLTEKENGTTFTKQKYVEAIETVTIPSDNIPLTIGAIYNMFYTSSPTLWGQSIKLSSSMGNIYPAQFKNTFVPADISATQPIIITNALGPVTITLTSLTGKVLATTTRNIVSSCQSSLQDFNLSGMCTPSNTSLPSPKEISPGQATSTYMDPTGKSVYNETEVNSTTQTFSWTPVVGASKYALYVRNLDTNVLEVIEENLITTTYNTSVLKSGAHYKWNVRAKSVDGRGGWLSDSYWFVVKSGVANAIDDGTAVKYILVDETNDPIASTTISVECLNKDDTKCTAANQLQLFVQNAITDSYGNYLLARSIYPSYIKFKTSVTVDGITKENVSEFTTAIVKELIVQIPRQKAVDEAVVLGLLGGAYDLVKGLGEFAYVLVIHTKETVYSLVDSVENYEKVGNALYEGLQARKAEIFYVDPDNYISIYNGSKALGRTTFDVCTIACTLGGGAVVKGTQLAKVAIDVSKTADKVVEVNKLVEVLRLAGITKILNLFKDAKTVDDLAQIAKVNTLPGITIEGTSASVLGGTKESVKALVARFEAEGWKREFSTDGLVINYNSLDKLQRITYREFATSDAAMRAAGHVPEVTLDLLKPNNKGQMERFAEIKFISK